MSFRNDCFSGALYCGGFMMGAVESLYKDDAPVTFSRDEVASMLLCFVQDWASFVGSQQLHSRAAATARNVGLPVVTLNSEDVN